jgi:hypothetical protein
MIREYHEPSGIQAFFKGIVDRFTLRDRPFGQVYAYVNPWHAAMDDEIENIRIRSFRQQAKKWAERKRAERSARPEGPQLHL